jgi:hypothetical protein
VKALSKWWDELESDDRTVAVIAAAIWLTLMCLLNPAVPILLIFFAGMYSVTREERPSSLDRYLEAMKERKNDG